MMDISMENPRDGRELEVQNRGIHPKCSWLLKQFCSTEGCLVVSRKERWCLATIRDFFCLHKGAGIERRLS